MACNPLPQPLAVICGMAFEAAIAQGARIHVIHGLNPQKRIMDIEQAIRRGAAGLLSFGTAAGLSPALAPGAMVIAQQVHTAPQTFNADAGWAARLHAQLPDAHVAPIAGVDNPLASVQEKSALWAQTGAAAADMESHYVARLAQLHRLPFAALRVVLDSAGCALPPAALAATRPDGGINYAGLTGSLLARPQQLPALMRLSADHRAAKAALLRCGELLKGSLFGMDVG